MWLQRSTTLLQKSVSGSILPTLWQNGVRWVDTDLYRTADLGGREENKHRAWYGDKVLGYHVAKTTMSLFQDSLDRHTASSIASVALSNRFLQKHLPVILPKEAGESQPVSKEDDTAWTRRKSKTWPLT